MIRRGIGEVLKRRLSTEAVGESVRTVEIARPSSRAVTGWLWGCAGLTAGMVTLGGLTRLTESGLSIVEWKPVLGMLPPLGQAAWEAEFEQYKQYPEFATLNAHMTLDEFKGIFWYEWAHRNLGRAIGVLWTVPFVAFAARGRLSGRELVQGTAITLGIGAQGALGWYMVSSGLEPPPKEGERGHDTYVPRVSHYRLAAHLGTAFAILSGMTWMGLTRLRPVPHPWVDRLASAVPGGPVLHSTTSLSDFASRLRALTAFRSRASGAVHLVLVTALWGALVAGLDAGLVYNTFPYMNDKLVPTDVLFDKELEDQRWRNFVENNAAVQWTHRVLATGTGVATLSLAWKARRAQLWRSFPTSTKLALLAMLGAVTAQYSLGILTVLSSVMIPVAAAHQAGSMVLLTSGLWLLHELRRIPK